MADNAVGDRTSRVDPLTGTSSYGYDQAHRLTSYNSNAASYSYDGDGVRTSKTVGGVTTPFAWDESAGLPLMLDDATTSYLYGAGRQVLEQIQNTPAITIVGTGSAQDNGSGSSLTVPLPTGVLVRDQILLAVTANASQTITTPTGYTLTQAASATGNNTQTVVLRKTAAGGETSATVAFGADVRPKAVLAAIYRGVDPTTPIDVKTTGSAAVTTSLALGSITTTGANERLVLLAGATGNATAATWTPPTGMTDQVHLSTQALVSTLVADQTLTTAGATGSRTATVTASGDLTGVLLALRPAPANAYYYQGDQLGSTRLVTDQSGAIAATYSYDPYGKTTAHTGSLNTPFQYTGQYRDTETNLYYLRARYYDPQTAQFLTRDPLEARTHSAYGYVGGDPLNAIDPTGLAPCAPGQNGGGCVGGSPLPPGFDTWAQFQAHMNAERASNACQGAQFRADYQETLDGLHALQAAQAAVDAANRRVEEAARSSHGPSFGSRAAHFAEGVEFAVDAAGTVAFGTAVIGLGVALEPPSLGGSTLIVGSGVAIAGLGGSTLAVFSYKSFSEAFQ